MNELLEYLAAHQEHANETYERRREAITTLATRKDNQEEDR